MITAFLMSLTVHLMLIAALAIHSPRKPGGPAPGDKQEQKKGQGEGEGEAGKDKQFQPKADNGKGENTPVEVALIQLPPKKKEKAPPCKDWYGGIGMKSMGPFIEEIAPGYAAERAGVKVGDKILSDWRGSAIRGKPGTSLTMIVERNGQTLTFQITREKVCMKP